MENNSEIPRTLYADALAPREKIPSADKIVATTNFFYKDYHALPDSQQRDVSDTDGIRGDFAIQSLDKAINQGIQVVAADGGSSEDFLTTLKRFDSSGLLTLVHTKKPGRGPQRRAAFEAAIQIAGKQAVIYFQPEKEGLMDYVTKITSPILNGAADIVVVARAPELFEKYYPEYMVKSELRVNKTYNWLIHRYGLLPENVNLDWFFGPVVFRNNPEIVSYFLKEYCLKPQTKSRIGAQPNPELHSDGHYFPIIEGLFQKKKVAGVEIPFVYPKAQRDNEMAPERVTQFRQRRKLDAAAYRLEAIHFLAYLKGNPNSKIQPIEKAN